MSDVGVAVSPARSTRLLHHGRSPVGLARRRSVRFPRAAEEVAPAAEEVAPAPETTEPAPEVVEPAPETTEAAPEVVEPAPELPATADEVPAAIAAAAETAGAPPPIPLYSIETRELPEDGKEAFDWKKQEMQLFQTIEDERLVRSRVHMLEFQQEFETVSMFLESRLTLCRRVNDYFNRVLRESQQEAQTHAFLRNVAAEPIGDAILKPVFEHLATQHTVRAQEESDFSLFLMNTLCVNCMKLFQMYDATIKAIGTEIDAMRQKIDRSYKICLGYWDDVKVTMRNLKNAHDVGEPFDKDLVPGLIQYYGLLTHSRAVFASCHEQFDAIVARISRLEDRRVSALSEIFAQYSDYCEKLGSSVCHGLPAFPSPEESLKILQAAIQARKDAFDEESRPLMDLPICDELTPALDSRLVVKYGTVSYVTTGEENPCIALLTVDNTILLYPIRDDEVENWFVSAENVPLRAIKVNNCSDALAREADWSFSLVEKTTRAVFFTNMVSHVLRVGSKSALEGWLAAMSSLRPRRSGTVAV